MKVEVICFFNGKKQRALRRSGSLLLLASMFAAGAMAQNHPGSTTAVQDVQKDTVAVNIRLLDGLLRIQPCENNVARITYSPVQKIPNLANPYLSTAPCAATAFTVQDDAKAVTVRLADLTVEVSRSTGAVRFADAQGKELLEESGFPQPRQVKPVVTDGEATHRASVWFALAQEEKLYGLGQHQNGILNQRNLEMELSQDNTNISIPFFLSSKGYGVLWNNASVTRWNNRFQPVLNVSSNVADAIDYFFVDRKSVV